MVKYVSVLIICFVTSSSFGNVFISWGANDGFYELGGGSGSLLGLGTGNRALAQLLWRPNNTGVLNGGADHADANTANYVSGDDVWLADYLLIEGSTAGEWATFTAPNYDDGGALGAGGYVYARIFADETPTVGTWYYTAPVVVADNRNPGAPDFQTPQTYLMNREFGDRLDQGDFAFQVVPEPGTLAMLALGIATLGGAAHKKRKDAAVEA